MALFVFSKNTTGANSANTESVTLSGRDPTVNRNGLAYKIGEWDAAVNDFHNIVINANLVDLPASSVISAVRIKLFQISNAGTKDLIARTSLRPWTQTTATWNDFTTASPWAAAGGAYNAADADIVVANQSAVARATVNNATYITITLSAAQIAKAQAAYLAGDKLNVILGTTFLTTAINETVYGAPWGTDAQRPIIEIDYTTGTATNAPVNTVPAAQTAVTATVKAIAGIKANDVDGNLATTRLTVVSGLINVSLAGGATISVGANNSAALTLSGTQVQINAALATVTYTSNAGFTGADTLTVLSSDSSATPLTDSDTVAINVIPPDTAPLNTVPAAQSANTGVAKAITGISVNDVNGNLATVKLTVNGGLVSVTLGTTGAVISAGANNSLTLTLSGTQAQINGALATVSYISSVVGDFILTVLSTDAGGLTDTDTIAIAVRDSVALQGVDFNVPPTYTNGVTVNGSGQLVMPAGITSFQVNIQTLTDSLFNEANELVTYSLGGFSATGTIINNANTSINPISELFVTEASYGVLSPSQRTAAATGGGYPLFVVTKNAADTATGFDVLVSTTSNGTYTSYLTDQPFTPTALINGVVNRAHPVLAITDESNFPSTISTVTKAVMYDSSGQREWMELNTLGVAKSIAGETSRVIENVTEAIWDMAMPIEVAQEKYARVALLTTPSIGTLLADAAVRFFKIIPKIIGGVSIDPALVTPVALTIVSKSRKPYPVRNPLFYRNENPVFGSAFPENELDDGRTGISIFPSARDEAATSSFFNQAPAFETGVTKHADFKRPNGALLRTKTIGSTNVVHYELSERAADMAGPAFQVELYTMKNGIESERFVHVVKQKVPFSNTVTAVTPAFLSTNIRTAVTLAATTGGTAGTGEETGVYYIRLSGTLFPTVNMDAMSIDGGAATIASYDKTKGELIVTAPRALPSFILITPFTGTGTITVFAGYRQEPFPYEIGATNSATI